MPRPGLMQRLGFTWPWLIALLLGLGLFSAGFTYFFTSMMKQSGAAIMQPFARHPVVVRELGDFQSATMNTLATQNEPGFNQFSPSNPIVVDVVGSEAEGRMVIEGTRPGTVPKRAELRLADDRRLAIVPISDMSTERLVEAFEEIIARDGRAAIEMIQGWERALPAIEGEAAGGSLTEDDADGSPRGPGRNVGSLRELTEQLRQSLREVPEREEATEDQADD